MARFERLQHLFYPDSDIIAQKELRRTNRSSNIQPRDAQLRDDLWILLRLAAIVATVGLIALVVHGC
jgi:hypothetical protein